MHNVLIISELTLLVFQHFITSTLNEDKGKTTSTMDSFKYEKKQNLFLSTKSHILKTTSPNTDARTYRHTKVREAELREDLLLLFFFYRSVKIKS